MSEPGSRRWSPDPDRAASTDTRRGAPLDTHAVGGELELRASDADREQVAARLGDACAEGRITVEELSHRLEATFAARTLGELAALTADLPVPRPTAPAAKPARKRRPKLPGIRPFRERFVATVPRDRVFDSALVALAPRLEACGYRLVSREERSIAFERDRRPGWTYVVAVVVFPVGLLALLHHEHSRVLLSLSETAGGTEVTASGTAPLPIRRAFVELREDRPR